MLGSVLRWCGIDPLYPDGEPKYAGSLKADDFLYGADVAYTEGLRDLGYAMEQMALEALATKDTIRWG